MAFWAGSRRAAETLQAADIFGRLRLIEGAPLVESAPSVARAIVRLWLPAGGDGRSAYVDTVSHRGSRARA